MDVIEKCYSIIPENFSILWHLSLKACTWIFIINLTKSFMLIDIRKEDIYAEASKALRSVKKSETSGDSKEDFDKMNAMPSFPDIVLYIQEKV